MSNRFTCIPFTSDESHLKAIEDFVVDREAEYANDPEEVIGLEAYLKRLAWNDDLNGDVKIYLIIDTEINCVAAYFGLKAGMVVDNEEGIPSDKEKEEVLKEYNAKLVTAVVPGIEISHLAINDNYRRRVSSGGKLIRGLAQYFYPTFIYPIIDEVSERIGVKLIYLYAAGDDHLEQYYNIYIRDFFTDNPGKNLEEAIRCWKYKKNLKGHNRYERSDLNALKV